MGVSLRSLSLWRRQDFHVLYLTAAKRFEYRLDDVVRFNGCFRGLSALGWPFGHYYGACLFDRCMSYNTTALAMNVVWSSRSSDGSSIPGEDSNYRKV